jgi:hypothetical protein
MNHADTNATLVIIVFVAFIAIMVIGFALIATVFIVLIFFVGKKVAAVRMKEIERHVEDWLAEEGYELVRISDEGTEDSPFRDRRPRRPGIVRTIEAKDRRGRVPRGWVFFPARMGARGYSGFRLEAMEVEWEQ